MRGGVKVNYPNNAPFLPKIVFSGQIPLSQRTSGGMVVHEDGERALVVVEVVLPARGLLVGRGRPSGRRVVDGHLQQHSFAIGCKNTRNSDHTSFPLQ